MSPYGEPWILRIIITLLALADGTIHFLLDVILFRGRFFGGFGPPAGPRPAPAPGRTGPPPGPPIQLPLPLNEMFLLNFLGYIVLIVLFWLGPALLAGRRWLIDVLMIVYVTLAFLAWWEIGRPNPMGLGYLSKSIEVLLVIALLVHARIVVLRNTVRAGGTAY